MWIVKLTLVLVLGIEAVHSVCEYDVDLGFIIDGSGSIRRMNPEDGSYDNWDLLLKFVANVTDGLPREGTQVGAVLYSRHAELLFPLNQYGPTTASRVILNTTFPGGRTNTSGGLYTALTQLFNESNGDRPDVPNAAVVISDGVSNCDYHRTVPYAKEMHQNGVNMIAIGVSQYIYLPEIKNISSPPHTEDQNYFNVDSFLNLTQIVDKVLASTCPDTTTTTAVP